MDCCLERGEVVRLDCTKDGINLRCVSGRIWVTTGDGRDYLLSAGKSLPLPAGILAVVEALQAAECAVMKPLPACNAVQRPIIRVVPC